MTKEEFQKQLMKKQMEKLDGMPLQLLDMKTVKAFRKQDLKELTNEERVNSLINSYAGLSNTGNYIDKT